MPDIYAAKRTALALSTHLGAGPITRSQALRIVSAQELRTALSRGTVVRLRHGSYVVARPDRGDRDQYRARIAAALEARPEAVASHESALALMELSQPEFGGSWQLCPVRLTAASGGRVRRDSLVVTQRPLPDHHTIATPWGAATNPLRTAADLARETPFPLALIAADECCALSILRDGGWKGTLQERRQRAGQWRPVLAEGSPGAAEGLRGILTDVPVRTGHLRAEQVAAWVDPCSESPGESFSRAHLVAAGLPRPVLALPVQGLDGTGYTADMAWPPWRVLAEVDGYGKYRADPWKTFRSEKRREDALRAAGWLVVRWTVAEMLRDPHMVTVRVRTVLAHAGCT